MKHKSKVKNYTNSLINIASKMKIFKEVNESLNIILTFFQKDSTFRSFLYSKSINGDDKSLIISKIFNKKCHPVVCEMISILSNKNELSLLKKITQNFTKQNNRISKIIKIKAYLAKELNEDEQNILKLKMDKLFKESIQLDFHVSSEIIGGVKLRVDNFLFVGSIQEQLKRLKDQIN